MAVQK
jgi:hypothetical protein